MIFQVHQRKLKRLRKAYFKLERQWVQHPIHRRRPTSTAPAHGAARHHLPTPTPNLLLGVRQGAAEREGSGHAATACGAHSGTQPSAVPAVICPASGHRAGSAAAAPRATAPVPLRAGATAPLAQLARASTAAAGQRHVGSVECLELRALDGSVRQLTFTAGSLPRRVSWAGAMEEASANARQRQPVDGCSPALLRLKARRATAAG